MTLNDFDEWAENRIKSIKQTTRTIMSYKKIAGITLFYIILSHFYPIQGYEFVDANTRCNKATGCIEVYHNTTYSRGWSKR